ncbi:helix-turn-helix transcriptional regulator [Halobacterium yunchengense]|uniref:helix-turn-helix transcriptional regulator n=1 Tax=Halobacterium yunchengense TaxID=3108497 RepID=UPI00300AA491
MASQTDHDVAGAAVRTLLDRRQFLEALLDGPKDKRALVAETDVSRSTVDRAVRDLEAQGLAERANGEYEPTAYGELLAEEFESLVETASVAWELGDLLECLPRDALGFRLSRLADATVTTPTTANPAAPLERVVELKRGASRVRSMAAGRSPGALDAHEEAAAAGDHTFESVVSVDLVAWLVADDGRRETLAGLLDADGVSVHAYDGEIPVPLGVADDVAFFGVESEEGAPVAVVETRDERVREWAVDAFEDRRRAATELDPADLEDYVRE